MAWNSQNLAENFRREARRAELRAKECRLKQARSDMYKTWADEAEAEYMVANRLAEEARTNTPEKMLEWLTNFDPSAFHNRVFDKGVFVSRIEDLVRQWTKVAQDEIQRRENT